jgi:hypothetical protein
LTAARRAGTVAAVTELGTTQDAGAGAGVEAMGAQRWQRRALVLAPLVVVVAVLAQRSIAAVLARVGHPGAALDDAYIHFQYARAIAEGHPLRFQAGEPFTSGATSLLWPALLAPFWLLGARDEAILWPAWALSYIALGGLAWEASRLTERLAGRAAAVGAGAMVLAFSGFTWCAASGMEVVPFAWAIARATRRAAEWIERPREERTARQAWELTALAWAATLFRPEGAVQAIFVAAALAGFPRAGGARAEAWRERARGAAALAAVAAVPLLLWALTGSPRSNTAVAKLLPGNPYYVGDLLVEKVVYQVRQLVSDLLNGEKWSAEFLPHGGAPVLLAGLGAIGVCGWQRGARWRAAGALLLALTMFAPCLYNTFLWNRLRYLWPFMTGWLVGLACLARVAGDLLAAAQARWRIATPVLCGVFAGLLASKVEGTIDDVAWSASGIDRQQVALGRWVAQNLPSGARVGVNDTGAIAYFGDRRTFDIVGLTTDDEARYYVAGAGSRFEHYEHLRGSGKLPTHFVVYPDWMGLTSVLGETLTEASVSDAGRSILGGETMVAYVADWSRLGSGEKPWTPGALAGGEPLDVLDVADLESEAAHDYQLLGAHEFEQVVREGGTPDGDFAVDGGRTRRMQESFVAHLPAGVAVRCIVRLQGGPTTVAHVLANGEPVGDLAIDYEPDWVERAVDLPASAAGPRTRIEVRAAGGPITTYHYWFFAQVRAKTTGG